MRETEGVTPRVHGCMCARQSFSVMLILVCYIRCKIIIASYVYKSALVAHVHLRQIIAHVMLQLIS